MPKKKLLIDKHILIPKHSKVSDSQKEKILKEYKVTIKQLPKISSSDAAIQNLDVKAGDLVKIVRESPTAGESVYFRVVADV